MEIGTRIGDYEILGELGRGGMGRVFRVRNVISDRVEAMKVLLPDLAGRQDLARRFLREIKVLAALDHPNIAALRTALTAENQLVMIMEFVEGQSLAARLEHRPIAAPDALSYIDQALAALAYAHERGVVHRDVKPANMMLTPQGLVKLTDFGIARSATDETLTAVGTTTGSLSYMSPEQVNGEALDARSDLYSLGISLYEMVTGQRPFKADSDFHVMLAHLKQTPRPPAELQPDIPEALNALILRAIAKRKGERFQSAAEFRDALRPVCGGRLGATASRQVTVVTATGPTPALRRDSPAPSPAAGGQTSDRARTRHDTRTPPAPPMGGAAAASAPIHAAPQANMRSGHPLLFVALGAVLVVSALVATGLYLGRAEAGSESPRAGSADASGPAPAAASDAPAETAHAPAAVPAAAAADAASPERPAVAAGTPQSEAPPPLSAPLAPVTPSEPSAGAVSTASPATARSAGAPASRRSSPAVTPLAPAAPTEAPAAPAAPSASPAPAQPSAASPAELDALEQEIDQLAVRAGAVNGTLDRMREQQARQGLGLRGDISARQESLRINLARAAEAIEKGDAARAAKYRDATRSDVTAIERFLGR